MSSFSFDDKSSAFNKDAKFESTPIQGQVSNFSTIFLDNSFGDSLRFNLYFNSNNSNNNSNNNLLNPYNNYLEDNYKQYSQQESYLNQEEIFNYTLDENITNEVRVESNRLFTGVNSASKKIFNAFDNQADLFSDRFSRLEKNYLFLNLTNETRELNSHSNVYQFTKQALDDLIWQDIMHIPENLVHLNSELEQFQRQKTLSNTFNSITSTLPDEIYFNKQKNINLINNLSYVNRPGILPAIGLIKNAQKELYIDIYQLNNTNVRNYIYTKLLTQVLDKNPNKPKIKFNFRLAAPIENHQSLGASSYDILGDNILFYRGIELLKEQYPELKESINFRFSNQYSHPKFLLTEGSAIIGSMNLTNPLGQSIFQAGSNFESIRILHNRTSRQKDFKKLKNSEIIALTSNLNDAETRMFAQAQKLMLDIFEQEKSSIPLLKSGYANILRPFEIYQQLEKTLNYLDSHKILSIDNKNYSGQFISVLNQPFLLQHEKELFETKGLSGEMRNAFGENIDDTYPTTGIYNSKVTGYKNIQISVLNSLISNNALIIVDPHNYREKVATPIYEKLLNLGLLEQYDYSINKLINSIISNRNQPVDNLIQQLTSNFSGKIDESMARQILAMTSGNIQIAAVPRVHSKMYGLVYTNTQNPQDQIGKSFYLGSSNLGYYSLAYNETDALVNEEVGFALIDQEIRKNLNHLQELQLEPQQETFELQKSVANLNNTLKLLGRKSGQIKYLDVDNDFWQSAYSDRQKLESLFNQLKFLSNKTKAFSVERIFSEKNNLVELMVKIQNENSISRSYRFSATKDIYNSNKSNILAVDQGKLITGIQYTNQTSDILYTGFGAIGAEQRISLSAENTTVALIASLAYENQATILVKAPVEFYLQNYSLLNKNFEAGSRTNQQALATASLNYLSFLFGSTDLNNTLNYTGNQLQKTILTNFLSRYERGNKTYNQIHEFAGINLTDSKIIKARREALTEIANVLAQFASNEDLNFRKNLLGFGDYNYSDWHKTFAGVLFNKLDTLINQQQGNQFIFGDILYDFINSQNNYLYHSQLNTKLKNIHSRQFEPWLTPTQARVYSANQTVHRLPLFGINEFNTQAFNAINNASRNGQLAAYALLNNPLDFGPADFIGNGLPVFIKIAEGAGSKGGVEDTTLLKNRYNNILPMKYNQNVGDLYNLKLLGDTGVGSIITSESVSEYLQNLKNLNFDITDIESNLKNYSKSLFPDRDSWTLINFNFDGSGKEASIPQRLKNVIGTRPLLDISTFYQLALELQPNQKNLNKETKQEINSQYFKSLNYYSNTITDEFNTNTVKSDYLTSLKYRLQRLNKSEFILNKVDRFFVFGAIFSGNIKYNLSQEQAIALESVVSEVAKEFDLDKEVQEEKTLLQELVRAKILGHQINNSYTSGLIGTSTRNKKPQLNLIALGGAFSDYTFTNPYYGNQTFIFGNQEFNLESIRKGFYDQATKSIKGSLFSTNSSILSDIEKLIGTTKSLSGASISYDSNRDAYILYDTLGNEKQIITSRKEIKILTNVFQESGWNPSAGIVTATSNAASIRGESAIENLMEVKILAGSDQTNEQRIELNFLRTLIEGGGRRLEAFTGLFKAPPIYSSKSIMQNIYDQIKNTALFAGDNNNLNNLYSLSSVNNLKSYFLEHGSVLISQKINHKSYFQNHLDFYRKNSQINLGSQLATALVLSFSLESFGNVSSETRDKLYSALGSKQANNYLKNLQTGFLIHEKIISELDLGKKILGIKDNNKQRQDFNFLTAPSLKSLDLNLIISALEGSLNAGTQLESILSDRILNYDSQKVFNYLTTDTIRGRELATVAGNLDFMLQLINTQSFNFSQVVFNSNQNDSNYHLLSSIMGATYNQQMNPDQEFKNLIQSFANTVPFVGLYSSLSGSQSKVPVSSKKLAQLEFQHLVTGPFVGQLRNFQQQGNIDSLRQVMGTVLGFMYQTSVSFQTLQLKHLENSLFDFTTTAALNNPLLKTQLLGYYANPLTSQGNLKQDRATYQLFSVLQATNNFGTIKNILNKNKTNFYLSSNFKENIYLQNLQSLVNKNIYNKNIQKAIRKNINQGLYEFENKFKILSYNYQAETEKILNIEQAEAISSSINKHGLPRFAFALPSWNKIGNKIIVNREQKLHGFVLSGADVKIIGEQFGEFQSEISKYLLEIWGGLAPGGEVREFLNIVANSQENEFEISDYMLEKVSKFYSASLNLQTKLYDTFSGRQMQEIFGNKVRLKGGTAVAAASFYVPLRMQYGAEAMLNKHNSALNQEKINALTELKSIKDILYSDRVSFYQEELSAMQNLIKEKLDAKNLAKAKARNFKNIVNQFLLNNNPYLDYINIIKSLQSTSTNKFELTFWNTLNSRYYQAWQETDIYQNIKQQKNYFFTQSKKALNNLQAQQILFKKRKEESKFYLERNSFYQNYLTSQINAIQQGMSPGGNLALKNLEQNSLRLQNQIKNLTNNNFNLALTIETQIQQGLNSVQLGYGKNSGDNLVKYTSLAELKILRGELANQIEKSFDLNLANNNQRKKINNILKNAENDRDLINYLRNKTPYIINQKNLLVGSGYEVTRQKEYKLSHLDLTQGGLYTNLSSSLKLEKYYSNPDSLSNLISNLKNNYLNNYNETLNKLISNNQLTTNEYKLKSRNHIETLKTKLDYFANQINDIKSSNLNLIEQRDKLAEVRLDLEIEINKFSAWSSLDYLQSFRSPPPGNLELSKALFGVGSIENLNSFTKEVINTDFFDINRNKTLTLFNPHSILVSMLGDFDGDTISSVLVHKGELELKLTDLKSYKQHLETNTPEKTNIIKNTQKRINELELSINKLNTDLNYDKYEDSLKTWTANYLKLDKKLIQDLPVTTLLSWVEQGRGLFDNYLGGIFDSIKPLYEELSTLDNKLGSREIANVQDFFKEDNNAQDFSLLKQIIVDNSFYEENLFKIFTNGKTERESYIRNYITKVGQDKRAYELAVKYTNKSVGSTLTLDQMAGLQQALGQAGSVILGKTYNTTIGLLYSQAPVLALGEFILNNPQYEDRMNNVLNSSGLNINDLKKSAFQAKTQAQQMGGFLQDLHQLIRDSIKPKGSINDFLDKITILREQYNTANSEQRTRIVEEMSALVDVDPLLNLDKFVSNLHILNDNQNRIDVEENQNNVTRRLGLDSNTIEILESRLTQTNKNFFGLGKGTKTALIAAYATKQELIGLVTKFAFENLKLEDNTSAGMKSVLEHQFSILENKLNSNDPKLNKNLYTSIETLTNDAYQFFNNSQTNQLSIESQEYIDFLNKSIINQDSEFFKNNNTIEQKLLALQYLNTKSSVNLFAGITGEKLLDFAKYNQLRDFLYNQFDNTENIVGTYFDPSSNPHTATLLQALTSGKIDSPDKIGKAFESLVSGFMEAGNLTEKQANIKVFETLLNSPNLIGDANQNQKNVLEAGKLLLNNTVDSEFSDLLLNHLRSSAFGMQAESLKTIINQSKVYMFDNSEQNLAKHLKETYSISLQEAQNITKTIKGAQIKGLQGQSDALDRAIKNIHSGKKINTPKTIKYKNVLKKLPQSSDLIAETSLFPLLGLIGNYIATGDVSPEIIQNTLGGIVTTLSYTSNSNIKMAGMNIAVGSAFKARLGLSQEDPVAGLASIIGQEVMFAAGGSLLTQKISNQIANKILAKPQNSLDIDNFAGTRNFISNLIGGSASYSIAMAATNLLNKTINKNLHQQKITQAYQNLAPVENLLSLQMQAAINNFNQAALNVSYEESFDEDNNLVDIVDDLYYVLANSYDVEQFESDIEENSFEENNIDANNEEIEIYI